MPSDVDWAMLGREVGYAAFISVHRRPLSRFAAEAATEAANQELARCLRVLGYTAAWRPRIQIDLLSAETPRDTKIGFAYEHQILDDTSAQAQALLEGIITGWKSMSQGAFAQALTGWG